MHKGRGKVQREWPSEETTCNERDARRDGGCKEPKQEEDDLDDAPVRCWGLVVENLVGTVGGEVVGQHREQHHQSGKVQEESQPEVIHHSLGTTHEHVGDVGQEVAHRGPGDESGEDEALEDVI
jgi:hypothetical protein